MNPFAGTKLYVNPESSAAVQAALLKNTLEGAIIEKIASQPLCIWLGDWNQDITQDTARFSRAAQGTLPVFVLYNIPDRDIGQYSAGGARHEEYLSWIKGFLQGLEGREAAVILEPDAVIHIVTAPVMEKAKADARCSLLADATRLLKTHNVSVYLDAGNPWYDPAAITPLLIRSGIEIADGFAVNVSNFYTTEECVAYGSSIAATLKKNFIIDTSRNGKGVYNSHENEFWCNPPGRALGHPPTTQTGHNFVDAFLWVKTPGESDGECRGGPKAGEWWTEYALDLVRNSTMHR